jgi:hypothetical protein
MIRLVWSVRFGDGRLGLDGHELVTIQGVWLSGYV